MRLHRLLGYVAELVSVEACSRHTIALRFADGTTGEIYMGRLVELESFRPIQSDAAFRRVYADCADNAVCWPAGIRLDAGVIYLDIRAREGHPAARAHCGALKRAVERLEIRAAERDQSFQRFMQRAVGG